jgi:hypothetical protein
MSDTVTPGPATTAASSSGPPPVTATAVEPLSVSFWKNRVVYVSLSTAALFVILAGAIFADRHVDVVAWLLATMFVLYLVAPSAEQAVKMLATVAALRAGVAFTSTADVDQKAGTASSTSTATPAAAPPPAPLQD